jgi:O-antigen ligase
LFSSVFINHNFSAPIDIHASYLSLYLVLALISFLDLVMHTTSGKRKLLYAVCLFILFAGLLQLSSRSVFIVFLIFVIFVAPVYYFTGRRRIGAVMAGAIFSLALILMISKVEVFRDRFWTGLEYDLSSTDHKQEVSDPRLERWALAWELSKQSPWTGYGSGSEVRVLGRAYFEHQLYNSFLHRLNAHNQYLSFLLKSGVFALLAYVLVLVLGLKYAIHKRDIHFAGFMLLIIVVSFGENILDANKGVFFYSFFFSFFIAQHYRTIKVKVGSPQRQKVLFNTETVDAY